MRSCTSDSRETEQLLRHYLHPEIHLNNKHPIEFLLEVRNGHSNAPVAHALHQLSWEVLEDTNLWQDVFQVKSYSYTYSLSSPYDHVANTVSSYNLHLDFFLTELPYCRLDPGMIKRWPVSLPCCALQWSTLLALLRVGLSFFLDKFQVPFPSNFDYPTSVAWHGVA